MTLFEQQFNVLQHDYEGATFRQLGSGAYLIIVPNITLPDHWTRPTTTVYFVAPAGYPFGKPDCFWTDPDLRLRNGAMPQGANLTNIPEVNEPPRLWFSWHANQWSPNRDSLVTYVHVIEARLRQPR